MTPAQETPVSRRLTACRACGGDDLETVLDLGDQHLTGVFPAAGEAHPPQGPLQLVLCRSCHLLQLGHSHDPSCLYGDNYGYRSGLNASMVRHLTDKARALTRMADLRHGDLVLDIGSNDGTFLRGLDTPGLIKLGMDPTAGKFSGFYDQHTRLVVDFFSRDRLVAELGDDARARLITSIAMFYDLESPPAFIDDIAASLANDGLWHFEQSYMPSMLRMNSYDTICHEHLEYYSFTIVHRLLSQAGLKVVDLRTNSINGGSFAVTAALKSSHHPEATALIDWMLASEAGMGLGDPATYHRFGQRIRRHRDDLRRLIEALRRDGARIIGCGASTKGNVILQYCGLGPAEIEAIADINPDKWGGVTPGTGIPIISEEEARALNPDCMLVLPWHFREGIIAREREFLQGGGRLLFPLPEIEIVGF